MSDTTAVEKRIQEILSSLGYFNDDNIDKRILKTQLEMLVMEAKLEFINE